MWWIYFSICIYMNKVGSEYFSCGNGVGVYLISVFYVCKKGGRELVYSFTVLFLRISHPG